MGHSNNPPQSPLVRGEENTHQSPPIGGEGNTPLHHLAGREDHTPQSLIVGEEENLPSPPLTRGGREGFIPYNKNHTVLARENRKNPTQAESRIWNEILRGRQLAGYKFLRQKPIGQYILDFYCSELQLAIELDGDTHANTVEYDLLRTAFLNKLGLTVIRYSNTEILQNIEGVYQDLVRRIQTRNS